jgi:hypothetical protein
MQLVLEDGCHKEHEAARKSLSAQPTSAQLSGYSAAYQYAALRAAFEAAWGDEFTLQRCGNYVLCNGESPIKNIRLRMFGEA